MDKALGFALKTAIAGLILSLIGGIIGGVDFGVIILRMLIGALVAGALGAGLFFLISKFLPELLTISLKDDENPLDAGLDAVIQTDGPGSNVDIVIDDSGDSRSDAGPRDTDLDQAEDLRREQRTIEQSATRKQQGAGLDSMDEDDMVPMAPDGGNTRPSAAGNLFVDDENTIIEEVQENASVQTAGSLPDDDDFYSGVQNLPDISGMSDSFNDGTFSDEDEVPEGETGTDSDMGSALSGFSGSETSIGNNRGDSDSDPKMMADAIRTILKKE